MLNFDYGSTYFFEIKCVKLIHQCIYKLKTEEVKRRGNHDLPTVYNSAIYFSILHEYKFKIEHYYLIFEPVHFLSYCCNVQY